DRGDDRADPEDDEHQKERRDEEIGGASPLIPAPGPVHGRQFMVRPGAAGAWSVAAPAPAADPQRPRSATSRASASSQAFSGVLRAFSIVSISSPMIFSVRCQS